MPSIKPGAIGVMAEETACRYLSDRGLVATCRNFRTKQGEIDLIMRDGETTVFVEVRARTSTAFGHPAETIGLTKQKRIGRAARYYLSKLDRVPACRFDVVTLTGGNKSIEWIRDAFRVDV